MQPRFGNIFVLVFLIPKAFANISSQLWELKPRSNITEAVPSPLVVAPSQYWDGDDGEWSSFALRVGLPAQDVRVLVSTNSPETMVVLPEGCSKQALNPVPNDCAQSRGGIFDTNSSTTWQGQGLYGINYEGVGLEANLGYSQNADYGLETLGLGYVAGTSSPTLQNQTVAGIATVSPFYLGVLGLSTQPVNYSSIGNYSAPSFFTSLRSQKLIPSLSWSYTAGAKYRLKAGQYAQLIFGGFDSSRFTSNSATFNLAGDIDRDIVVAIQSITYSGTTQTSMLETPIYAFIESTDVNIWLPEAACEAFEKAFDLSLDNTTNLYLINTTHYSTLLATDPQVTFSLANSLSGGQAVSIVLPFSAFALSASYPFTTNDTYYFPLKKAANDTQYTLGRTFLQEAYLTVDYERGNFSVSQCVWNDGAASEISTIISSSYGSGSSSSSSSGGTSSSNTVNSNTKHNNTGAIVGGVVGGIAVLIALTAAFFLILRNRRQAADAAATQSIVLTQIAQADEEKKSPTPNPPGSPAPLYKKDEAASVHRQEDTDGELGSSGEIYQMPETHNEQDGDYASLAKRMASQRKAYNTHEIGGVAIMYELAGDMPSPVEMDDERSRVGLLAATPSEAGRPSTRGSSKSRAAGPVPSCLPS